MTPTAFLRVVIAALGVFIVPTTASANTFRDTDSIVFDQLSKNALALHKDINGAMGVLGRTHQFEQASCLSELENAIIPMVDSLSFVSDLIWVSSQMNDATDELIVNKTLALNVKSALRDFAEERRYALTQGALCANSALVNTYAQKTAQLADRAIELLTGLNSRVARFMDYHP
jgi:hypothetical protein